MENPIENFWSLKLAAVKDALEKNNFDVHVVADADAAKALVLDEIIAELKPQSISWGGSMTHAQTGIYDALKNRDDVDLLDTYDKSLDQKAIYERRRQALLCDLFITGTNAVTEDGMLVNLDMIGNRVGAITFGPRHVIILVGRNKIVADMDAAIARIKDFVAPANTMRLDMKTPCVKTGACHDCSSPQRICNTWTITEKSFPKGRVKVVLIDADLGL